MVIATAHAAAHAGAVVHAAAVIALLMLLLRWVGVVVIVGAVFGVLVQNLFFELVQETHGD